MNAFQNRRGRILGLVVLSALVFFSVWMRHTFPPRAESTSGKPDNNPTPNEAAVVAMTEKLRQMDKLLALSKAEIEKTPEASIPVAATPDGKPKQVVPVVANIAVPKPRISVGTNQAGAESRTYVFPELYAIDGDLVARDVEFGGVFGLSVVFRPIESPEKSAFSMDLDRVHPEMLKAMGQDPRRLQQAQADREEQRRKTAEQARKSATANLQAAVERSIALVRSRELRAYDEALERERRIEQDLERQRSEIEAMYARAASLEPPPQRYRILRPRAGAT